MSYNWKWFSAGRMSQVSLTCGADVAALAELDRKQWIAISMPTTGVRFDLRMLELMDTDHDGRIRTPEVLAAIDFLKSKNVDFDSLFSAGEAEEKALEEKRKREAITAAEMAEINEELDSEERRNGWFRVKSKQSGSFKAHGHAVPRKVLKKNAAKRKAEEERAKKYAKNKKKK